MSYYPNTPQPQSYQPAYMQSAMVPPRKKNPTCLILVLVFGILGVFFGLCICGFGFFAFYTQQQPVTAQDRRAVIDAEDIAGWTDDFSPRAEHETLTKSKYMDGSIELAYEYEDVQDDESPYISFTVNVERTKPDADAFYSTVWTSALFGVQLRGGSDIEVDERPNAISWGDRSRFAILKNGNLPFGNILVAQRGNLIVVFMIGGVYFDESTIGDLMQPSFDELNNYTGE